MATNYKERFSLLDIASTSSIVPLTEEKTKTSDTISSSSVFQKDERFQQFLKKTPNTIDTSDIVNTFVNGDSYREPIEYISQAKFTKEIHFNLVKSGYHAVFPIQRYSWNEILLGRAMTIVNPKCSGKTMAYLPSLLTLLSDIDNEIDNSQGPVGIIFVSSSREVENIYKLCRKMVDLKNISIVKAFGKWNCPEKQLKLLNGVHLLITTPPCFIRLLSQVEDLIIIDRERIQYLVFDNFDLIYEKFKTELLRVMKMTTRGADHPEKNPQIIITTSKWLSCSNNMLKLSCRPLVIIGDPIEAGIYAKSRFIVKRMSQEEKQKSIIANLKLGNYRVEKTIVFVKNELELGHLIGICRRHSIDFISLNSYDSNESQHDINEDIWKQSDENMLKVVLATDKTMINYRVKNAQVIVHYSLPEKWTVFSKRFGSSLAYYKNYLNTNKRCSNLIPKAIIMLDHDNVMEIPRMISFLRDHRLVKVIPPEVSELVNEITQDLERFKVEAQEQKLIEICYNILKFGKCTTINCLERHAFIEHYDKPQYLPTTGMIKFKLYAVKNPLHFVIKIKEVCASENGKWISWKEQNEEIKTKLKELQELMGNSDNRIIQAPIVVDDICAYFHAIDIKWYRAKVIYVGTPDEDNPLKFEVRIHLIDKGEKITVRPTLLLKLDETYKAFRPLMFDLRILNFIPFDSDDCFDEETKKQVENIFKQKKYNGQYVVSKIALSFQNTIFTKNFHVMKFLQNLKIDAVQLHLKDLLLSKEYAIRDEEIAMRVLMLAEKGGLALPKKEGDEPVREEIEEPKEGEIVKFMPKWELLEGGKSYNLKLAKYTSPDEFYVMLVDKYDAMANEVNNACATKLLKNIEKNAFCLYVPEITEKFRAKIVNDGVLEIFLLDVGFTLKCLPKELYEMPNQLIVKDIPFTAVKCKIAGIIPKFNKETWDDRYAAAFKCLLRELEVDKIIQMTIENKVDEKSYEVSFYNKKMKANIIEIAVEEGIADSKEIQIENARAHFERLFLNEDALDTIPTNQLNQLVGLPETVKLLPPERMMPKEKSNTLESTKEQPKPHSFTDKSQVRRSLFVMKLKQGLNAPPKLIEELKKDPVKLKKDPVKLIDLYRHPHVEWYQKDLIIGLKIKFIDAEDYSLEIDETSVSICIKYQTKSLEFAKIYLYGLVNPEYCSHIKKENLIRVRLLKRAMDVEWPRLTYSKERNSFIKFRDEADEIATTKNKVNGTVDVNWMPSDYYDNMEDANCKDFEDDMNNPEMF